MKKEKDKKINFNTDHYKYMDDMPLGGWIWEFIRRSAKYCELLGDCSCLLAMIEPDIKKEKTISPAILDEVQHILASLATFIIFNEGNGINRKTHLLISQSRPFGIPRPEIRYCDFAREARPLIRGMFKATVKTFNYTDKVIYQQNALILLSQLIPDFGCANNISDYVFIGIPRTVLIDDVERYLPNLIKDHLIPHR